MQIDTSPTSAGSIQRAKTAWTKVKDIVTPATRRGSADLLASDARSSSAEPCRVPAADNADEADPWIEKRPRRQQDISRDDRGGRSSVSPPRTSERQRGRKRFSVSHSTSVSAARTTLSNSPLDLAGLLGMSKSLSTLSQKSATAAEFGECRRCLAVFCDSRTFLRQCGQGLTVIV